MIGHNKTGKDSRSKALGSEFGGKKLKKQRIQQNISTILYSTKKMGGISNFQIEEAFKKINDEDL